MNLDFREEIFWYFSARERELAEEKENLIHRRIAASLDSEPTRQRLLQIDFEFQKLELEKEEYENGG